MRAAAGRAATRTSTRRTTRTCVTCRRRARMTATAVKSLLRNRHSNCTDCDMLPIKIELYIDR